MIYCKKHFIAAGVMLLLPLMGWSEAPVVDNSDNFAIIDNPQAYEARGGNSKYDNYQTDDYSGDDGPALAKDDQTDGSPSSVTHSAELIDKIQTLQQEVQELRGQLEVQTHDLKLLQQQQAAFYKDLDARISGTASVKNSLGKPSMDLSLGESPSTTKSDVIQNTQSAAPAIVIPTSRANPADEQIGYLAAYELVKSRRYDEALNAMNHFVQKYPKGGYTANAEYWLGELYLVKKDHEKAIEHFNRVLQQFPTSGKSAASMLKVGYAYAAMGNKQEAVKFLQQVVRAYPNTPTAQLANSKLQTI